jgi:uncharacterized protein
VTSQKVPCRSTDGLELEAEADDVEEPSAAVVLCHPHPKMGGTMNAPLLLALRDAFIRRGWPVLRFNFRGIGASEGESSIGLAEVEDAAGAVASARDRWAGVPIVLVGWSFGAAVAVRLAERDDSLAACVAIAPAVVPRGNVTAGLPIASDAEVDVPLLLVCAAHDEVAPCPGCEAWAQETRADYRTIAGANHFFWGKYERLAAVLEQWLDDVL